MIIRTRQLLSVFGKCRPLIFLAFFSLAYMPAALMAQTQPLSGAARSIQDQAQIVQARGQDPGVNYRSLTRYGAWDDRNYGVTRADLSLLPDNDQFLHNVPVFFKVFLRKEQPELGDFYPRSAVQYFQILHGGLKVNDVLYREGLGIGYHPEPGDPAINSASRAARAATNEVILDLNARGNEVTVECNPTNQLECVAGSNRTSGQTMYWSDDGGVTWNLSQTNPSSCCDPTIDWSSDGSRVYQADLSSSIGVRWAVSTDSGQTWGPMQVLTASGSDKEFIHVDRSATSPNQDNIYLTYHNSNTMQFARSTDLGVSFDTPISFTAEPSGIGSDITTDAAGNIYYFYPALGGQGIRLLTSTDGGLTFATGTQVTPLNGLFDFPIPAMETREAFIYVSADVDMNTGDIYVAWTDEADDSAGAGMGSAANSHGWIQVAKSTDQGATWTVLPHPHDVTDLLSGTPIDRFHPWLKVAEDGVVHIAYYDTRNSTNRTGVDYYYTYSTDGGLSWETEQRFSSETSPNLTDGQEWGDYNGLTVVLDTLIGTWTDNRPTNDPITANDKVAMAGKGDVGLGSGTTRSEFYQYAAKIVCGVQQDPEDMRLAKGFYATTINIHNPHNENSSLKKKLALSFPPKEQRPGKILPIGEDKLGPDDAVKTDCMDIQARLFPNGFPAPYIEGFVVIQSPQSLDVTAVYTAAAIDRRGQVTEQVSIDVEQIHERKFMPTVSQCSDLIIRDIGRPSVSCPTGGGSCVTKTSITAANIGDGDAGTFVLRTTLDPGQSVVVNNVVAGGMTGSSEQAMVVTTPPGGNCFDPDCQICATIDAKSEVMECDEENNTMCRIFPG
jgi:hypothetical protein